jgi:hypothetical protein
MIRIYHRSVDDVDLAAMTEGRGSFARNIVALTLPTTIGLFVVIYLVFRSLFAAILISGLFFVGSTISNVRFFRKVRARERSKTDPRAVEVMDVEASRVLNIEHVGSHGPAYCFFVGDGKALLLIGQWLLNQRKFPSLSFRLARWSHNGDPIRVEVVGKKVKPEHSVVGLKSNYSYNDIEVFNASPDTLQQDLQSAFGKRT